MIMVNVSVVLYIENNKVYLLFWVYDKFDVDRLIVFIFYLSEVGILYSIVEGVLLVDFIVVVSKISGCLDQELIQIMLLCFMKQVIYDGDNIGYFGLVLDVYVYFMLLICCYLDLVVYRMFKVIFKKQGQIVYGVKLYSEEEVE